MSIAVMESITIIKDMLMKKEIIVICILGLATSLMGAVQDDSFNIEKRNGVPQIMKNGTPVPSRMLYVHWKSPCVVELTPNWQDIKLDYQAVTDCDSAVVHLRLIDKVVGRMAGEFWFSCIEVEDMTTGKIIKRYSLDTNLDRDISWWCEGRSANPPIVVSGQKKSSDGYGTLHVAAEKDPEGKLNGFHLILSGLDVRKDHHYQLRCRARAGTDAVVVSSIFRQKPLPDCIAYPGYAVEQQVKLAKDVGVDLVEIRVPGVWIEPGKLPDYSAIDRNYQAVLKANPNAKIIPRMWQNPPDWWLKRYPNELMKFEGNSSLQHPSIASEQYRKDIKEALRLLIRYSEAHYGANMAGYHPSGGNTEEWFYNGSWGDALSGYDNSTLVAWRKYLREKYGSDMALQQAWHRPEVTFANAVVPAPSERRGKIGQAFHLPATAANVIDFNMFQQQSMADIVLSLGKVIREETGKKRLSVVFYGYLFEFGSMKNGPATSGHYALRRLLNSPDIDIFAGPIAYYDRQLGGGTTTMTAAESILAAGKLWLNEDDTSTHLAFQRGNPAAGNQCSAKSQQESIMLLRRNLTVETLRNFATWWMDLGGTGWFGDQVFWQEITRLAPIVQDLLDHPSSFSPAIAEIIDENSILYVGSAGVIPALRPMIKIDRNSRSIAGVSSGQYLFDDLLADRLPTQLNVIVAAYALDSRQRRQLRAQAGMKPTIWGWATAYVDREGKVSSADAIWEATGFKVKELVNSSFSTKATSAGLAFGLPKEVLAPGKEIIEPVLSPIPHLGDIVLAEYADGQPAIVLRPGKVPALFCGTPIVASVLYRRFAEYSGIKMYTDRPAYVLANGNYLSICAPEDGVYKINTGWSGEIIDGIEKKTLGLGPSIKLSLHKGQIVLLRKK